MPGTISRHFHRLGSDALITRAQAAKRTCDEVDESQPDMGRRAAAGSCGRLRRSRDIGSSNHSRCGRTEAQGCGMLSRLCGYNASMIRWTPTR